MRVMAVWWRDAHARDDSWVAVGPLDGNDRDPYIVLTVGLLLGRRDGRKPGHVSIARSITKDGYLDAILHIPRGMVTAKQHIGNLDLGNGTRWPDNVSVVDRSM